MCVCVCVVCLCVCVGVWVYVYVVWVYGVLIGLNRFVFRNRATTRSREVVQRISRYIESKVWWYVCVLCMYVCVCVCVCVVGVCNLVCAMEKWLCVNGERCESCSLTGREPF